MAFRSEARISALVIAMAASALGACVPVRHGELCISGDTIAFNEHGKPPRVWKFEQIQQLELSGDAMRILTYEDRKWKLGRDREFVFEHLPEAFVKSAYAAWRDKLDGRFVAGFADPDVQSTVQWPAKLTGLLKGVEGTLLFGDDRIVFRANRPEESRTWRFSDIDNVSSAGPFDLSIVTLEHHGLWNSGTREFRFQLQRPLEEARFNELWRKLVDRKKTG